MKRAITPFLLFKLRHSNLTKNITIPFQLNELAHKSSPKFFPYVESHLFASFIPILFYYQSRLFYRASRASLAHPCHTLPPVSQRSNLEEALNFAKSTEELMLAFKELEASLSESDKNEKRFGLNCLKVAEILFSTASEDLEKALSFALRALEILSKLGGEVSLPLVKALRFVGSLSCKIKRLDESLDSLETACQILVSMEKDGFRGKEFDSERIFVQLELVNTKTAMGWRWEALLSLKKSLQLRMLVLEPDSVELGLACKDVAEACAGIMEFDEALPLCLKALGIIEAKLGKDNKEVVQIRQLLVAIYVGLGENEEALVQNELCRAILLSLNLESELLDMEIEAANVQINLGRLGEALTNLKELIQKTGKESEARAFTLMSIAKVLFIQEKFIESKGCLDMSCDILNKLVSTSSGKVAEILLESSMLYEMMNEFETAITLMKRTLALNENVPHMQYILGSIFARIGWLLLLTGRVQDAVPYLESATTKLKSTFGPKNFGLGFAYKHLGQAYLETDKTQRAIQMLLLAKDIIEAAFGPQHEDSIDTCQYIANAYGVMGSYDIAMEFQRQVVDRWETHGSGVNNELREAIRLLRQLKRKIEGSPSAVFPANNLPKHLHK